VPREVQEIQEALAGRVFRVNQDPRVIVVLPERQEGLDHWDLEANQDLQDH